MRNNITQQGTPPPQCPAAFINGASHLYVYQEQKSFMQMHSGTIFYSKYSYIKKSENQFQASNYLNGALCFLSKTKINVSAGQRVKGVQTTSMQESLIF